MISVTSVVQIYLSLIKKKVSLPILTQSKELITQRLECTLDKRNVSSSNLLKLNTNKKEMTEWLKVIDCKFIEKIST